jgi:UDP-2-acetamido-2-deoxy-ribo-hexuluronate aminotransferase
MKNIPFNKFDGFYQNQKEEILHLTHEVFSSGKYIRAKHTRMLEESMQHITGRTYAITTASCTDALFFALKASGVQPGDEVILPAFSYIASLSPVLMCGAIPVFVDIDSRDWMLNMHAIEEAVTPKTKAIIFVQLFGSLRNIQHLHQWAKERGIVLIEDAAQALGSENGTSKGGGGGDISCISFDPTKIVSAFGTGGLVVTNNEAYYNTICKLIHHGRNSQGEFETLGYNSKIPELNAALILMQLKALPETILAMNAKAEYYKQQFCRWGEIKMILPEPNSVSTRHKMVISVNNRDALRSYLYKNGVETRVHYAKLLPEQMLMQNFSFVTHNMDVSSKAAQTALSLPIYPNLSAEEIDYICECILNFYKI